jgi:hypothetical protein
MTFPRIIKLLLICFPSLSRTPSAPVLAILSDPAKSTKFYMKKGSVNHSILETFSFVPHTGIQSKAHTKIDTRIASPEFTWSLALLSMT